MSARRFPNYLLNNSIYGMSGSGGSGSISIGASYGDDGSENEEDTRQYAQEETEESERSQDLDGSEAATSKGEDALNRSGDTFADRFSFEGMNARYLGQDIFSRLPHGGWTCFAGYAKPWYREQE